MSGSFGFHTFIFIVELCCVNHFIFHTVAFQARLEALSVRWKREDYFSKVSVLEHPVFCHNINVVA